MSYHRTRAIIMGRESVCAYCGTPFGPFHMDHMRPLSRGGDNRLDNLVMACAKCNLSKSNKELLSEWFPKRRSGWLWDLIPEAKEDRLPGEMD